jgi:UDP-glucose 4-epimerase
MKGAGIHPESLRPTQLRVVSVLTMRIVVTGGAGYIGSHTVVELIGAGHETVIVDNFGNAKPAVLDRIEQITGTRPSLVRGDVRNPRVLDQAFAGHTDAVIHFAGLKAVGESVAKPLAYYENNLDSTLVLLAAMERHDVRALVFSSSATVYGDDGVPPLREDAATGASSPYGWTKVMIEQILADSAVADHRFRLAALRYFNPMGAHPSGLIGEDPQGVPNNLVPYLAQVAVGRREEVLVFGDDYETPDGTGVRDYIHVVDLARGHIAALEHLTEPDADAGLGIWNLGSGVGTSVLELVRNFSAAVGRDLPFRIVERRPGDVASSFCDPGKAERELGWTAELSVAQGCVDTWRWQSANPDGFPDSPEPDRPETD